LADSVIFRLIILDYTVREQKSWKVVKDLGLALNLRRKHHYFRNYLEVSKLKGKLLVIAIHPKPIVVGGGVLARMDGHHHFCQ